MLFNMTKKRLSYCTGMALTMLNSVTLAQELISNGDFENGLNGWQVIIQDWSNGTGFFLATPGDSTPLSGYPTANNPSGGNRYVVTDQYGAGAIALIQPINIPPGVTSVALSFQMFVNDQSGVGPLIHPAGLDFNAGPNQHARVDILCEGNADALAFNTTGAVLQNLYIGIDGPLPPYNYTDYLFDITDTVMVPGTYNLRFAEVDNQWFFNLGVDNVSMIAQVEDIGTAQCQVYGVQDNGLNDSLFFTVNGGQLGAVHAGYDIEGLDIRPNHVLYGSSGRDVGAGKEKGYLYKIDAQTGALLPVGDIKNETQDFDEVDSLSFNPRDGTLWGWAKGEGLIQINPDDPSQTTLELPSTINIEDLTWDTTGNLLYGAWKTQLWVYDPTDQSLVLHPCVLPGKHEVEALEMVRHPELNNGEEFLLLGIHQGSGFNLRGIDLTTCEIVVDMPVPYDDVEGISFEPSTCPEIKRSCLPDNIRPIAITPPPPTAPQLYLSK
jgi:hypothetical protein